MALSLTHKFITLMNLIYMSRAWFRFILLMYICYLMRYKQSLEILRRKNVKDSNIQSAIGKVWKENRKLKLIKTECPQHHDLSHVEFNIWKNVITLPRASPVAQWGRIRLQYRRLVFHPRLVRSPGGRNGNPLQHSCLENLIDRGTWQAIVHGVTESWTQLKRLSTHTPFTFANYL